MFGWGKKKQEKNTEDIEREVVQSCVAQIQESFLDMNKQLTEAFGSFNQVTEKVETNAVNVAALSQAITTLAQYFNSLDTRLRKLEDQLTLSGVKFNKGNTN